MSLTNEQLTESLKSNKYQTINEVLIVVESMMNDGIIINTTNEQLIKELLPKQYEQQVELFKQVPEKWKFGNLFTSSISNYNISAPFHRDAGNIVGAVNVIICKKFNSKGGDLHIPDYGATIGQQDNYILVYPAWRNVHGVTPIIPTHEGGYRNSLVFYPLQAFINLD